MEKSSKAPVFQVDLSPGSDTLIVAFTGKAAKFNMIQPFDFFQLTGLLHYHRILIREPWHYVYLRGIDQTGLEGLKVRLQEEIQRIGAKRVIFMGVSSGGFISLLLGHLLQPDYVHAFSPFTYLDIPNGLRNKDYKNALWQWPLAVFRLNCLVPKAARRYLDLRPHLMTNRSKTKFYIHSCAHSSDRARAQHLVECPGLKVFLYPCANHNVTWGMVKSRCLKELLQEENLEKTEVIYQKFYGTFKPDECCGRKSSMEPQNMPKMKE
jgi:hypothetical protein